jgi:hypothetical protein
MSHSHPSPGCSRPACLFALHLDISLILEKVFLYSITEKVVLEKLFRWYVQESENSLWVVNAVIEHFRGGKLGPQLFYDFGPLIQNRPFEALPSEFTVNTKMDPEKVVSRPSSNSSIL